MAAWKDQDCELKDGMNGSTVPIQDDLINKWKEMEVAIDQRGKMDVAFGSLEGICQDFRRRITLTFTKSKL